MVAPPEKRWMDLAGSRRRSVAHEARERQPGARAPNGLLFSRNPEKTTESTEDTETEGEEEGLRILVPEPFFLGLTRFGGHHPKGENVHHAKEEKVHP
jgi:hypothetical protein